MISASTDHSASIHLDYDADSAPFDFSSLQICPRGMSLHTRWYFEPGSELSVNFQLNESDMGAASGSNPHRIFRTEGYVVECSSLRDGNDGYEVTVAFWEVTDDILAVIRDVVPMHELHG